MFKKATRQRVKLKMALTGISGSGKTMSALLVARGLVGQNGKIAVLDTENNSASLYSDVTDFDAASMTAPFSPKKYIDAINSAEAAGYDVLIIDSLSHAWDSEGGVLDIQAAKTKADRSNNSYTAWREVTPMHNALVQAILQSKMHVIVCMRSKIEYAIETNEKGRQAPRKIGLAPIQRAGLEYEFTIVFDLDKSQATAGKDRTGLFVDCCFVPSVETGEKITNWLMQAPEPTPQQLPQVANWEKCLQYMLSIFNEHGRDVALSQVQKRNSLTDEQIAAFDAAILSLTIKSDEQGVE